MSKVEELESKLAAMRADKAKAKAAQYEKDLEARIALEEEHDRVAAVEVSVYKTGFPTQAFVRMPTAGEYKRYRDLVNRAFADKKSIVPAQEQIAHACWVYPATKEERAAMAEAFSGILTPIGVAAVALAEGRAAEEGNG